MSSKIPSDRGSLERFIQALTSEVIQLQNRAESLKATYAQCISQGDADGALQAKKELESLPVKVEILQVRIAAAQAKLSTLLANEPAAQKIRADLVEKWKQLKVHCDAIDLAGEQARKGFAAIKDLEKTLYSLLGQHSQLTGLPMPHVPITYCERLPEFLGHYPQKPLSQLILEYPWRPWEPPTQAPQE